jgi:hypothetical protein
MSIRPVAAAQPRRLGRPGSPRPRSGAVRMRRALMLAGCGMLSVGLCACESTEQESARIGRESEPATHAAARTAQKAAGARAGASRPHSRAHGAAHAPSGKAPSSSGSKSP